LLQSALADNAARGFERQNAFKSRNIDEKAPEEVRKPLIGRFSKPSGLSDEEGMKKAASIIEHEANNGLIEAWCTDFATRLCIDRGRA